jgi:DNA polymerase-3 subunit gamma/tau
MVEALSIRDIDAMIRTLQKELSGVTPTPATTPPSVRPKEKEIDITAVAPEVSAPVSRPTVPEEPAAPATPRPEPVPETTPKTPPAPAAEPEPEPTPEPSAEPEPATDNTAADEEAARRFRALLEKIYDRDYDLGAAFERNITFKSFEDHTLTWLSTAEGADKKTLIHGWSIIKMFVQETFGMETKIVNVPSEAKKKTELSRPRPAAVSDQPTPAESSPQPASMIEEVEMGQSCVDPIPANTEAAKEKDPSSLLDEPMIKEMIKLFDPKKVRIVRKS